MDSHGLTPFGVAEKRAAKLLFNSLFGVASRKEMQALDDDTSLIVGKTSNLKHALSQTEEYKTAMNARVQNFCTRVCVFVCA